ncbi:hypothetical protein IWQ60_007723 [Tieghemiomyces parasiticus]|uniref:Protein kinase domain-containing protein n=1 Tax=Tieghemiomyces parasiticus TaxID=78921 RepID=A0A9W8A3S2_9FUNG|nr:hypothetical protein IWQ60_007723 [Tieghemiomyces parasiticus]
MANPLARVLNNTLNKPPSSCHPQPDGSSAALHPPATLLNTPGPATSYLTTSPSLYPAHLMTGTPPAASHRYHYHHKHTTDHAVIADPTGRFERYDTILGRGAYKKVYVAFDHEEGVEVAWNEIKVDHLRRPERRKIWSEISILKTLRHDSVLNLFHAWTAMNQHGIENIYFVTEFMSSGTLRQFIKKSKGPIKPRVLKNWCVQILRGLDYLHHYDPPIIHRDLKCDNIFVNGNSGHLKIGDLGLATFKHREHASSVLGTPEYMAPEMYEERYNERVDIYAFGMCVLEMVTKEYPYVECTNPAQIYRRVTAGIQPASLDRIVDPDIKSFIRHCIQSDPALRPSAAELLQHPFLTQLESLSGLGPSESPAEPAGSLSSFDSTTAATKPGLHRAPSRPVYPVANNTVTTALIAVAPHATAMSTASVSILPPALSSRTSSSSSLSIPVPEPTARAAVVAVKVLGFNADCHELQLEVQCSAPNADAQVVAFPFHLLSDTPYSVVVEMIKEGVLSDSELPMAEHRIAHTLEAWFDASIRANPALVRNAHGYPYFSSAAKTNPLPPHDYVPCQTQGGDPACDPAVISGHPAAAGSSGYQCEFPTVLDATPHPGNDTSCGESLSSGSESDGEVSDLELDVPFLPLANSEHMNDPTGDENPPSGGTPLAIVRSHDPVLPGDSSTRRRYPFLVDRHGLQQSRASLARHVSERRAHRPHTPALPDTVCCSTPCSPSFAGRTLRPSRSRESHSTNGHVESLPAETFVYPDFESVDRPLHHQLSQLHVQTSDQHGLLPYVSLGDPALPPYLARSVSSQYSSAQEIEARLAAHQSDGLSSADESLWTSRRPSSGGLPSPSCSNCQQPIPIPFASTNTFSARSTPFVGPTSLPSALHLSSWSTPSTLVVPSTTAAPDPLLTGNSLPGHPSSHLASSAGATLPTRQQLVNGSGISSGPPAPADHDPEVLALWVRHQQEAAALLRQQQQEWQTLMSLKRTQADLDTANPATSSPQ